MCPGVIKRVQADTERLDSDATSSAVICSAYASLLPLSLMGGGSLTRRVAHEPQVRRARR